MCTSQSAIFLCNNVEIIDTHAFWGKKKVSLAGWRHACLAVTKRGLPQESMVTVASVIP